MRKCLCGSGKPINDCHGDISPNKLRNYLWLNITGIKDHRVHLERHIVSKEYEKQSLSCDITFIEAYTPAGVIHYPILLTNGTKSVRPITIDGLAFMKVESKTYQYIDCMLTPNISSTIGFDLNCVHIDKSGLRHAKCELIVSGDPFNSVFAIETEGDEIALYHHTNNIAKGLIEKSFRLNCSKWNFAGTEELIAPQYIYLTDIPVIEGAFDLSEIGMTDPGTTLSIVSDLGLIKEVKVYRDNPSNRTATIKVWVDINMLTPNHLILHGVDSNIRVGESGGFSWWEIFNPHIFRVAVEPGKYLPIEHNISKDAFVLNRNENYVTDKPFISSFGMDARSILNLWSEVGARGIGKSAPEINNVWSKTWDKNVYGVARKKIEERIRNM